MRFTTRPRALLLTLALPLLGCDSVLEHRSQDGPSAADLCAAAEAADDKCELAHGDDADACKPFDDVDEACEVDEVSDADSCPLADSLDEECEALFGEDAPECAELDRRRRVVPGRRGRRRGRRRRG